MITDNEQYFSDSQAVTASAVSTHTVDLKTNVNDLGVGAQAYLVVLVKETVTAAGSATVDFAYVDDDDPALGSPATLRSTGAIGKAALTAGAVVAIWQLPRNTQRYVGLSYTVATGPLTAGKFSAFVTRNPDQWKGVPDAVTHF